MQCAACWTDQGLGMLRTARLVGYGAMAALVSIVTTTPASAQQSAVGKTAAVNQDAKVEGRVLEIGAGSCTRKDHDRRPRRGAASVHRPHHAEHRSEQRHRDRRIRVRSEQEGRSDDRLARQGADVVRRRPDHAQRHGHGENSARHLASAAAWWISSWKAATSPRRTRSAIVTLRPTSGPGVGQAFNIPQGHTARPTAERGRPSR